MPLPLRLPLSLEQDLVPYTGLKPIRFEGVHGLSFMHLAEVEFLYHRLRETDGNLLEIGSAAGATVAALLHACPEARATCVDKFYDFTEDAVNDSGEAHLLSWFRNCLAVNRRMSLIVGDFQNTLSLPQFANFDLILLDANHSFVSVAMDLLHLWRIARECRIQVTNQVYLSVSPDAVLILHDYGSPSWPGVTEAVDMLCQPQVVTVGGSEIRCEAFFDKMTTCESLVELKFRDTDQLTALEWYAVVQHVSQKVAEATSDSTGDSAAA